MPVHFLIDQAAGALPVEPSACQETERAGGWRQTQPSLREFYSGRAGAGLYSVLPFHVHGELATCRTPCRTPSCTPSLLRILPRHTLRHSRTASCIPCELPHTSAPQIPYSNPPVLSGLRPARTHFRDAPAQKTRARTRTRRPLVASAMPRSGGSTGVPLPCPCRYQVAPHITELRV